MRSDKTYRLREPPHPLLNWRSYVPTHTNFLELLFIYNSIWLDHISGETCALLLDAGNIASISAVEPIGARSATQDLL
jgi:hypothetical protein